MGGQTQKKGQNVRELLLVGLPITLRLSGRDICLRQLISEAAMVLVIVVEEGLTVWGEKGKETGIGGKIGGKTGKQKEEC